MEKKKTPTDIFKLRVTCDPLRTERSSFSLFFSYSFAISEKATQTKLCKRSPKATPTDVFIRNDSTFTSSHLLLGSLPHNTPFVKSNVKSSSKTSILSNFSGEDKNPGGYKQIAEYSIAHFWRGTCGGRGRFHLDNELCTIAPVR